EIRLEAAGFEPVDNLPDLFGHFNCHLNPPSAKKRAAALCGQVMAPQYEDNIPQQAAPRQARETLLSVFLFYPNNNPRQEQFWRFGY
ncbi:MAG: hypothetical protein GX189_06475, partial [Clostridiales bacterium]|nr:hypothetical protein [Clostridiales bacterium]